MSKRVAVYARVSTTRQAENDISIPDQLAQARRFCQERGWHVMREYVDAGASARDDKRPEFQRMMDAACIDPSPYDVVLFHSQSRFFRDVAGYTFWKRKLLKHGVSLLSMTQGFGEGPSADFAETVLAAADEYTSAETAKHVTRTMLENAKQGFWNGSLPPFGYRAIAVERRGQRIKKRLEVDPRAAEVVRTVFRLFRDGDGRKGPMGVKEITSWLNGHGFKNGRGKAFYISEVHAILTRDAYTGTFHYNRTNSRTGKERPKSEWVAVQVPVIIDAKEFANVQRRLVQRRPAMTAPRVSNSDVLLTGIARCETCGAALVLRTGKSGRYRYYACASHRLKGGNTCKAPISVPEGELNGLVLGALAGHLLVPERLTLLLREVQKQRRALASGDAQQRRALSRQVKETERQIKNLYAALADGTVSDTALFRETLQASEAKREEAVQLLSSLAASNPPLRRTLSKAQAAGLASKLRHALLDAPAPLQRRYVRGLVSNIVVNHDQAVVSGPKEALAAALSTGTVNPGVLTFVRDWRSQPDSNRCFSLERAAS